MTDKKIKVSIAVITYKQEQFIGHTLESIVSQKTDFAYEVIVGDDCSPDNTAAIVKEYANKYPDIIVPLIREKNMGMAANENDVCAHAKGEYLAFLEGDDYWIDENKLQKQVDFMDAHPEYVACYGHIIIVNEKDERNEDREKYSPYLKRFGDYTVKDLEDYMLPGQTGTSFFRKSEYDRMIAKSKEIGFDQNKMSDIILVILMLAAGKIYVAEDVYTAYRYMLAPESGSWSSKNDSYSIDNLMNYIRGLKDMEKLAGNLGFTLDFDVRRKYEWDKLMDNKESFRSEDIKLIKRTLTDDSNDKLRFGLHKVRRFIKR
ncbi:MAG: glycosyltransferase [Butyrivibrio sp.]|nr:glycosyltransferase [Butyrivibrio sp.]